MPENHFTLTVRATVTVTDLDALVRQVDELVALTPEFEPIKDGTYWDGWEDRAAPATCSRATPSGSTTTSRRWSTSA